MGEGVSDSEGSVRRGLLSWQKNKSVERTSPESKNHWKVTYWDGQEKWTDDKPGDGVGGRREKKLQERKQSRPSIKDAKATLDAAVKKYVKGDSTEKELAGVVDDVVVHVGREVARETIRGYIKGHKDGADEKTKEAHKILNDRQVAKLRKKEAMISQIADKIASDIELAEVFDWVKKQRTWLDWELDGDTIIGSTRENGRRGDEDEAGPEDIREAKRMRELIRGQFKDVVVFELETDDEWTNLSIRLNPRDKRSSVMVAGRNQYDNLEEAVDVTGDIGYMHGETELWYAKDEFTRDSFMGYDWLVKKGLLPDPKNLRATHVWIGRIHQSNLNRILRMMQGEVWSPEGEAHTMLTRKGVGHTSMHIGDIIILRKKAYMVDRSGFKELDRTGDEMKANDQLTAREARIASRIVHTAFSEREEAEIRLGEVLDDLKRIQGVGGAEVERWMGKDITVSVDVKFKSKNEHGEDTLIEPAVDLKVLSRHVRDVAGTWYADMEVPKQTGDAYDVGQITLHMKVR